MLAHCKIRVWALLLVVSWCADGFGADAWETPHTIQIKVYLPCNGQLPDYSSKMTKPMVEEGYVYRPGTDCYQDNDQEDNVPEQCTVTNFYDWVSSGDNMWINSHGAESGELCVSAFVDEGIRDDYVAEKYSAKNLFNRGELGLTTYEWAGRTYYVIAVGPDTIDKWTKNQGQIYWVSACYSADIKSNYQKSLCDSFHGGLVLGYHDKHYETEDRDNALRLFSYMTGAYGYRYKRCSGEALAMPGYTSNFDHFGSKWQSTVLAPTVRAHQP